MNALENFYAQHDEPVRSCLLAMRDIILSLDKDVSPAWRYGMPFFLYKGKRFCYLWYHKKLKQPYLGIVDGKHFTEPFLIQENRSKMKIMLLDPAKDLPARKINAILKKAVSYHKDGMAKIK